jgi:glycosyltransferase involved in cell wall biosynthesis
MKVCLFVHFYVPYRCAGSETMVHAMVKELIQAGHEVLVCATVLPDAPQQYHYDGVNVLATNKVYARQNVEKWKPDVIISHHDNTIVANQIARKLRIPFVFVAHNDMTGVETVLNLNPSLVVFNSMWLQEKLNRPGLTSIVVHPPVYAEQHKTTPGNKVTLINLNDHKGANILYELALRMPEVEFLGVIGGHGDQIVRKDLPNVEIQEHSDDMKSNVWSKTRILLMPSVYESYGMAGVEALASGIPVICNPTPGLLESQGSFGLFVDRRKVHKYEEHIRRLLEPAEWEAASVLALKRSAELDPKSEMVMWVSRLERLVHEHIPSH